MPLKLLIENPTFELDYILEEKNKSEPQNLYIKGPFLMAEEKNKNGRIYPINEMTTEVDRYLKEMVMKKRSLGELNHPSCITADSQVLTKTGWKCIKDISDTEELYTLNPDTNEIEIHQILRKIDEPYNGKLLKFKGRNINLRVTPNHKMPLVDRYGKLELVEAQEIYNNRTRYNHSYIPKTGTFVGNNVNEIIIPKVELDNANGIYLDERFLTIEEIDFDDRVYCVEVPNNIFYVMENGKACWTGNSCDVNPERACHMITELYRDNNMGNIFYGKAKILNTPMGNIVKSLIMEGVQLGVSSRALGKLSPTSNGNTVSNLHLICCDVVHDPSVPTAFVDGILESKDWIINADGTIAEYMDQSFSRLDRNLKRMPSFNSDEYLRGVIIDFLNSIK